MQPSRVIFLDFDGVLNSAASFKLQYRRNISRIDTMETLCHVCCSNFQYILDLAKNADVVISSTWREHYDLDWLKAKLLEYGIDSSRVIGVTPAFDRRIDGMYSSSTYVDRGVEIQDWLNACGKEYDRMVVIDDNYIGNGFEEKGVVVKTAWLTGLQLGHCLDALKILGSHSDGKGLPL